MQKRYIPNNLYPNIGKQRRIIEAIISMFITAGIVFIIPFIFKIKIVLAIISCLFVGFIFFRGIKGQAIGEIVQAEINFKKRRRKTHLRSINYIKQQKAGKYDEIKGDTEFERITNIIKKWYGEWKANTREKIASDIDKQEQSKAERSKNK